VVDCESNHYGFRQSVRGPRGGLPRCQARKAVGRSIAAPARCYGNLPALIDPLLRLDVLHIMGERVFMHRAIIDLHRSASPAPAFEPGGGELHPMLVVALSKVLAGIGAA
jgi:hypothetical protein